MVVDEVLYRIHQPVVILRWLSSIGVNRIMAITTKVTALLIVAIIPVVKIQFNLPIFTKWAGLGLLEKS